MIKRILSTSERNWVSIPLRLALGIIFIAHGGQKLFGWFGGYGLNATAGFFAEKLGMTPGILWASLAGFGEFLGGLLVLLGLLTRFGALNIAAVMLVAMFKVHWGAFFLPSGIEYTLALLSSAVVLLIAGGGRFSVDSQIQRIKINRYA